MDFEKGLSVKVHRGESLMVDVVMDSGSALIGSGGHCDVRLPPDQVALEQLYLEIQPGGLFAEVRSKWPLVLDNGVPFQRGRLLSGALLTIGPLSIRVELTQAKGKKADQTRVRPGVLVLAILFIPLGLFLAAPQRQGEADTDYKEAPPLFDKKPPSCPEAKAGSANNALIESWLRDAEALHERSPFSPEDGVAAVRLYRRAASCMEGLGRFGEAEDLKVGADGLALRLERDFHVHRVRLARELRENDVEAARHEVQLLRSYLSREGSEFALWLDYLERKLSPHTTAKGSKK